MATHTTPILPGRRRNNNTARGILIGLALSVPLWVFLGLAFYGARELLG